MSTCISFLVFFLIFAGTFNRIAHRKKHLVPAARTYTTATCTLNILTIQKPNRVRQDAVANLAATVLPLSRINLACVLSICLFVQL